MSQLVERACLRGDRLWAFNLVTRQPVLMARYLDLVTGLSYKDWQLQLMHSSPLQFLVEEAANQGDNFERFGNDRPPCLVYEKHNGQEFPVWTCRLRNFPVVKVLTVTSCEKEHFADMYRIARRFCLSRNHLEGERNGIYINRRRDGSRWMAIDLDPSMRSYLSVNDF